MEIVTYRNHNTKATCEENPLDIIKVAIFGTNLVLKFIDEINPKIREDYQRIQREGVIKWKKNTTNAIMQKQ